MLLHRHRFILLSDVKDLNLRTKKKIFRVGKKIHLLEMHRVTHKGLAVILWPSLVKPYVEIIRRSGEHRNLCQHWKQKKTS